MTTGVREMRFLLAGPEGRILRALAARVPRSIRSNHLTAIGTIGAAAAGIAYALTTYHPAWLWVASAMLVVAGLACRRLDARHNPGRHGRAVRRSLRPQSVPSREARATAVSLVGNWRGRRSIALHGGPGRRPCTPSCCGRPVAGTRGTK